MHRHYNDHDSSSPLRLSIMSTTSDDNTGEPNEEAVLENITKARNIGDLLPMVAIFLVLILVTGIMIALHFASTRIGNILEEAAGSITLPWWNTHLAMVVSICISSILGGLVLYLRMKKTDVILSTLLRKDGTRGDVFLDLMDGWFTSIRALLTFDSPVGASLFTFALILLQFTPAFSGLCVSTTEAMWQKGIGFIVTDLTPITMGAIGQLQFSTAVTNLERMFFRGQVFSTNFISPANDIAAANNFDNASLTAFKVTPICQLVQTNFVTNVPYINLNYVDLNVLSLKGNMVTPGMQPGQISNGVITGASLYWRQYFLKKAYNYGTYPNGSMDFVDEVVVLVNNTIPQSSQSNFTQVRAWTCRVNIETFVVAIDNTTRASGGVYMTEPTTIQRGPNPSRAIYPVHGQGLINGNVTSGQFLGLAAFLSGGLATTRALGYQGYLKDFDTNAVGTNLTADDLSLHLGDMALTLQLMSITGKRANATGFRNGTTAYTTINIEGAASLLSVAWGLCLLMVSGMWSSQRLRWSASGSSVAVLSMAATKSFSEAVQPYSFGDWSGMRKNIGHSRWRLGKIYSSKGQQYGFSNTPFSD
ncbi:hypothetical protein BC943DRAFT_313573 [Umbelopsis sp. AD052]|nr:hypothetical protein BC943DRAFT_313573 [Umbelopsis sp. AD052]